MKIGLGTPIWVPFEEREAAAALGASWRGGIRRYVVPQSRSLEAFARWNRPDLTGFPGEDRAAGGSDLYVDLVPSSCWFTNVRSCVDAVDWLRIRYFVGDRCKWTCEVCGLEAQDLDIHERWSYDEDTRVQRLVRLIGLCDGCHRVTHFGKAEIDGFGKAAFAHLCQVNSWTAEEAQGHIDRAFDVFEERSHFDWTLDLSLITEAGVALLHANAA
jgi:Domain of unknown function (DUF5710)